jgi:hypothetical protein
MLLAFKVVSAMVDPKVLSLVSFGSVSIGGLILWANRFSGQSLGISLFLSFCGFMAPWAYIFITTRHSDRF